ncbi:MAG: hypothetical protein HVN35_03360 [Methanobacteriaceae archaeon]|nr:hypothetical protein [Methanobacteriaceae archaeon]
MYENNDIELFNELQELGKTYLAGKKLEVVRVGNQIGIPQKDGTYKFRDGGPDLDPDLWTQAFLKICRGIKKQGQNMIKGIAEGNPVEIAKASAGVIFGIGALWIFGGAYAYDIIIKDWIEFNKTSNNTTNNNTNYTPNYP